LAAARGQARWFAKDATVVARTSASIKNAKVSVLIPTYNRQELLARAVSSAQSQTHQNIEIVISDNCSTDGTWASAQRFAAADPRIRCWRNDSNLGPLRNWIAGLEHCSGEYIKILWSDDWIEPTFIAESLAALAAYPQAGLAFTATLVHAADSDDVYYHFPQRHFYTVEEYLTEAVQSGHLPLSPGCTLVSRHAASFRCSYPRWGRLEKIALHTGAGSDMLFIWEAVLRSGGVVHVPRFLSHFDCSPTSITMTQYDRVAEGYRLARRFFLDFVVKDVQLRSRLQQQYRTVNHVPFLKRWERTLRTGVRRSAANVFARLGL
jgi:glycosyltransferase involved in cell wall biosynthesis